MAVSQANSSSSTHQPRMYYIPNGQTQLIIGIVPKETIIFDKTLAFLLVDKRYTCRRCPHLTFDKRTAAAGRSLIKHVNTIHPEETVDDLEVALPSSYRIRRKENITKVKNELDTDQEGEKKAYKTKLTIYEHEMELLKIGNPYRMNPYDAYIAECVPEEHRATSFVYPDPELFSI